jgi:hypothetical protein
MNARASTKECYVCHRRLSVDRMRKEHITKKSGHSGLSFSLLLGNSSTKPRGYSGRNYYRRRDIWICDNCETPISISSRKVGKIITWIVILFVVLLLIFPEYLGGLLFDFLRIFFNEDFSLK